MISYTLAQKEDCPFIHQWEQEVFQQKLPYDQLESDILFNTNSLYIVAKDAETIGYIGATVVDNHIDIINLFVSEDYRRQGIAKELVNRLSDYTETPKDVTITLDVKETNKHAIKLYQSLGFQMIDKRKNYYQDGKDAFVMKRSKE